MRPYVERIVHGGAVSVAYEQWAEDRINDLTEVCISPNSTVEQIRSAQAKINVLFEVVNLRELMQNELERD